MAYSLHMDKLDIPTVEQLNDAPLWKELRDAHRYLGEFKGLCVTLPNPNILIQCLVLREAKDSSEIENIITTHDSMYASNVSDEPLGIAEKEIEYYEEALLKGFDIVSDERMCRLDTILLIQSEIEKNNAGLRRVPGTVLRNDTTGETIYEPPQSKEVVERLMSELVTFMHEDDDMDELIRMAVTHHQFESIHPFYDGNGRAGRILNILMLVKSGLLDLPVFYLSRYINQTKQSYYGLLQETRETKDWLPWCKYIVKGVKETAQKEIEFLKKYRELMARYKHEIRAQLPNLYSQDLLNRLFAYPYTKIDFLMRELRISRPTASKYLDFLCQHEFLVRKKIGRNYFFINQPLLDLITHY